MQINLKSLSTKSNLNFILRVVVKAYELCRPKIAISYGERNLKVPLKSYLNNDGGWKIHLLRKFVPDGGTFVDVGANTGQTFVEWKLSGISGNYFGFEPNYEAAAIVSDIIKLNKYDDSFVAPFGLSDSNSVKKLFLRKGKSHDSEATIVRDLRPGTDYDVQLIPVYRFDDVVNDLDMSQINFIKIDVEGAENYVLSGMQRSIDLHNPTILCEVLFADNKASWDEYNSSIDSIENFIKTIDYKMYEVIKSDNKVSLNNIVRIPREIWTEQNQARCDYVFAPGDGSDVYEIYIDSP
jgi:FkbM family methyltransferase